MAAGGRRHALGGLFYEPTVLTGVTQSMRVAREKPSGRWRRCSASIPRKRWSPWPTTPSSAGRLLLHRERRPRWRVGEALDYGMVGHNTGLISNEVAPFGGVKQSGLGREGSKYGIDEYRR